MLSVAIIDIIGLTYDGDTLKTRGLGGSESAVILMSKELAALGFDVTVFNNCNDAAASEGTYDRVKYIDISRLHMFNNYKFDIVISSRTVLPFLPVTEYQAFMGVFDASRFAPIKKNAKLKVVWLHDTFCQGDHLLEQMVVNGDIDELFTLSDFHTSYITNCNHGTRRMYEVLKRKMFMTRNGATLYPGEVDIPGKDRNLFVYNASVTKGMIPLVNDVWPLVKQAIPTAKLIVIGGYYRFRENAAPDEQEKTWNQMILEPQHKANDVTFTGIITQYEISEILKRASFMLYPPAFPETFGISTLESLMYNTPLITSRFGALEETAIDQASYFMDYPATPNVLYPHINQPHQSAVLANLAIQAWNNTYLHQQKMYYCNIVKPVCGWDSVALQWKQHFFKKLGEYMPVEEYRKVSDINSRVHQIYGRRFYNTEENYIPRDKHSRSIVVVTPVYNAEKYIARCIESVSTQDYDNWHMYIIDDCSTDNTVKVINGMLARPDIKAGHIHLIENKVNMGAVYNHITTVRRHCAITDIVMLLDGDDALVNNNQLFQFYNNLYADGAEFTYGSCWSEADNIPLIAQPYPAAVKEARSYRQHKFNWNMPYTHLRTFSKHLLSWISTDDCFKDENGEWYRAGGDCATFYALIEQADPNKVVAIQDVVYLYNDLNEINDYKVNNEEQRATAAKILNGPTTL